MVKVMIFETLANFLSKIFFFTAYVNGETKFPEPLPIKEEEEHIKKMREGNMQSREILIRHNLRLVAHIVKKYSNAGEAEDLISVGNIGLIKGIESFKDDKGSKLATYAAKCIDNEILMFIRSSKKHRSNVSLSKSFGTDKHGNEITLMDILPMPDECILTTVENQVLWEKVRNILRKVLTKRELIIILARYGLDGNEPMTQLEVADRLKISRSYVSRIEKKAIQKLSKEFRQDK